ncbi:MAG: excinuclease ABC subunit UvrC [Phycisphaerae bacterium]|nr:excinuclease ABC subunit UvrC [Phycisphaerae bacterium]MDD5381011.1 excinuclease ABC subunit UvrC [Phycisphaerae bacterium]
MPAQTRDKFEAIREKIRGFPLGPGLYFMKGPADKVLYIGKAKNLRSRVASYFQQAADIAVSRGPKIVEMLTKVETVDFLESETEVAAMLQEARLIKDIHPPYNTDLIDDKTFPYLEITTDEDFPGIYITRKPRPSGRLFGPFAGAKDLRAVLVEMQQIFKFRTCKLDIKDDDTNRKFFRPCILYSIKQCAAPCAAKISRSEYKKIIKDLVKFLLSKRSIVLRQMKKQMAEAAAETNYEKAAMFRDRIRLIERLDHRGTPDEDVQPEVFAADPAEALEKLQLLLQSPQPVRIIEGIDVANISGAEAVGSLVKFIDGRPFKSGYRRFKIKTVKGVDDYAMIAEVVGRRYKYALQGEELWPDLILIDGGLGHLHAAQTALREMNAPPIKITAIAKREEDLYLQSSSKPLKLSRHSPVLKLLQYIRDEAHRFAQHYHHILRSKKILNKKF